MTLVMATEAQQAAVEALGAELVERLRAYIEAEFDPLDDATRNEVLGRFLVLSVFSAAHQVEWLNKVWLIDGVAAALGLTIAQFPKGEDVLRRRILDGIDTGRAELRAAFEPQGRA